MPTRTLQLAADDLEKLRGQLAQDAKDNLYLLGVLEEFGLGEGVSFHARIGDGGVLAALFVGGAGGLAVPCGRDLAELRALCAELGPSLKLRSVLGERGAVDLLLKHLLGTRPSLVRTQRLFSVSADDLGPFTNPTLRLAREEDLPALLPLAAGWVKDHFARDPLEEDPEGFKTRVLQRIRGKRTYVLEERGALVFKVEVGARSRFGAELEGLYTSPEARRRGHATLSLGQISRHLLSSLPRLTLRVDDQDPALAGLVRKVGFVPGKPQKLAVWG